MGWRLDGGRRLGDGRKLLEGLDDEEPETDASLRLAALNRLSFLGVARTPEQPWEDLIGTMGIEHLLLNPEAASDGSLFWVYLVTQEAGNHPSCPV